MSFVGKVIRDEKRRALEELRRMQHREWASWTDEAFLERVVERATPLTWDDREMPVATAEDLVLMKLDAGRPQDIDDVLAIKDGLGERLDLEYLRSQAETLDLGHALDVYLGDLAHARDGRP